MSVVAAKNDLVVGVAFSRQFPPAEDHPIVQLSDGTVISRYGDREWKFPGKSGGFLKVHFGDDPRKKIRLMEENGRRLRELMYFLYALGPRSIRPATLRHYFNCLLPIFRFCDAKGISVEKLDRYPQLVDEVSNCCLPSKKLVAKSLLLDIYSLRGDLGFYILSPRKVQRAFAGDAPLCTSQTPYIPARIWKYQISRLHDALSEFIVNKHQVSSVFDQIAELYMSAFGAEKAFEIKRSTDRQTVNKINAAVNKLLSDTGLDEVCSRWVPTGNIGIDSSPSNARAFSKYLSTMVFIGNLYIANYSGLRKQELQSLRSSSLRVEEDDRFGKVFIITGRTTKTVSDDKAEWITSSRVQIAFEVLREIARLRISIAQRNPKIKLRSIDVSDPYLSIGSYEPWGRGCRDHISEHAILLLNMDYSRWKERCPKLFCLEEITVTEQDMNEALHATDSLNVDKISIGRPWRFSIHQLRRTLAVNAACSGLVSDLSLQYEMKHLTLQMSLYYGRNSTRFTFDKSMVSEFRGEVFDAIAREALSLKSDRFVSPLGDANKSNLISFVTEADFKKTSSLAQKGKISLRPTMAGLCLSAEFCPSGGVDSIEECAGCPKALFDKRKRPILAALLEDSRLELLRQRFESPLKSSIERQIECLERILYELH